MSLHVRWSSFINLKLLIIGLFATKPCTGGLLTVAGYTWKYFQSVHYRCSYPLWWNMRFCGLMASTPDVFWHCSLFELFKSDWFALKLRYHVEIVLRISEPLYFVSDWGRRCRTNSSSIKRYSWSIGPIIRLMDRVYWPFVSIFGPSSYLCIDP
jgi:hypothetical protein